MELAIELLSLFSSLFTVLGFGVVIYQIRNTAKWNRRASNYNFINTEVSARLEKEVRNKIDQKHIVFKYGSGWSLDKEACKILISDHDTAFSVNQLLNDFQNLSVAYQENLVDKKVFEKIHSGRFVFWKKILTNYIEEAKMLYSDEKIWADFVLTSNYFIQKQSI